MKELSPRKRILCIAAMALALACLMSAQGFFLARSSLTGPTWSLVLRDALFGLIVGVVFGLLMVELPQRLLRRGKGRPLTRAVGAGVPLVGMAFMMTMVQSRSMGSIANALVFWGWAVPVGIGVGLIVAGRSARVGDSRHCPKCEYEFGFAEDDPDAPIRCPECGTGWLGRLAVGRRFASRRLMGAGVGVLAATVILITVLVSGVGVVRAAPTGVLLVWLGQSPMFGDGAAWAELATRTLTPEQRAALAARLLDQRRESRFSLSVKAKQWLEAEIAARSLPAELRERFFAEMFTGELEAPSRVRADEPFEAGFRRMWAADGFTYKCFVHIGGFGVGDNPPTVGRRDGSYYPSLIDRDASPWGTPLRQTLVADRPGETVVRAELWLVVQGGPLRDVVWNDDGSLVVPPGAAWAKRVVLERAIEVTP